MTDMPRYLCVRAQGSQLKLMFYIPFPLYRKQMFVTFFFQLMKDKQDVKKIQIFLAKTKMIYFIKFESCQCFKRITRLHSIWSSCKLPGRIFLSSERKWQREFVRRQTYINPFHQLLYFLHYLRLCLSVIPSPSFFICFCLHALFFFHSYSFILLQSFFSAFVLSFLFSLSFSIEKIFRFNLLSFQFTRLFRNIKPFNHSLFLSFDFFKYILVLLIFFFLSLKQIVTIFNFIIHSHDFIPRICVAIYTRLM